MSGYVFQLTQILGGDSRSGRGVLVVKWALREGLNRLG
jgi:hypothetical protein